jgi:acyl-CoA thioester hydrolase
MYTHDTTYRILYGQTDQMGYLYYGTYPLLYELGRVELMRSIGTTYKTLEVDHQVMMPVAELNSRYKRPAYYDDLLTIRTTLDTVPTKMITFNHSIYNAQDQLINEGYVKLFFVDMKTNKRVSCPTMITTPLLPYFETP